MTEFAKNFIDGRWEAALSKETFENRNPADTAQLVGVVVKLGKEDVDRAVEAARKAYRAVYLGWGRQDKKRLGLMTARDAERYLLEGQFPPGSMGPKIEAAVWFLEAGGEDVVIARPEDVQEAMEGKAGTGIVP